ncbi:TonB-dependent receptor [Sphingobium chungangianum]
MAMVEIGNYDCRRRRLVATFDGKQITEGFMRLFLLSSASALACFGMAGQANAQTADTNPQAPGEVSADTADAAAASAAEAAGEGETSGEDIVVTALRGRTDLQRTPAAVTVVGGELLARQQIVDVRGLQALVPSARFSAANTSTRIFIRGVGSALDFYWVPETTAVNLNGGYVPRFATTGGFYDIESVQVLPGPQGVLYGRSAGGGAVLINTRKPVFENTASGRFDYGNYDNIHVEGVANIALTDNLAVRGAVSLTNRDGYQSYGLQGDDSFSVRLSALYEPSDAVSFYLWGTHFKQTGKPTAAAYQPLDRSRSAWFVPANDPVTGRDNTTGSRLDYQYSMAGYALTVDLGGAELAYKGSYLRQSEKALRKLIGNDQVLDNAQSQYTQSLQLSGDSDVFDWIAGVEWFYAKSRFNSQLGPNRLGSILDPIRQRSISGFAQGTFHVTDALRLVAGARYTRDSLKLDGTNIRCFGPCVFPVVSFDESWRHLDVKGGFEADIAPRVLLYGNIQTGYAPGTVNTVVAQGVTPPAGVNREIRPQTLLAYTGGIKSTLADGLVTLNLEGYHYRYKNLIIQSFVAALNQQTLFNAPRATVYGLQGTLTLRPSDKDTLTANVAYTHGRYGDFQATPAARNIGGLQMVYTPDWTASLAYDRRFDLSGGARIDARIATYISSSYWGTFDHSGMVRQGSYTRSDASLTYVAPDDRWSAGVWIKNIENEAVATGLSSSGYAAPFSGATFLEPPRTYGVTLGFKI